MNFDDERRAFELWANTSGYDTKRDPATVNFLEDYDEPLTRAAWDAWQARALQQRADRL